MPAASVKECDPPDKLTGYNTQLTSASGTEFLPSFYNYFGETSGPSLYANEDLRPSWCDMGNHAPYRLPNTPMCLTPADFQSGEVETGYLPVVENTAIGLVCTWWTPYYRRRD